MDYTALLETFDQLVAAEAIYYVPAQVVPYNEAGYEVEFQIALGTTKKPQIEDKSRPCEERTADNAPPRIPCYGPGSDIADENPRLTIGVINETHLLVFNKFCVMRPQLLLLTKDSFRRQSEPLDLDDFNAALAVLSSIESPHLAFFNCGPASGSSREHKHVQVIPRPDHLFPENRSFDPSAIPFRYFLKYLDGERPLEGSTLLQRYEELFTKTKELLRPFVSDGDAYAHNVIIDRQWLLVIPRRCRNYRGVTTNAAGMVGSIWLKDESEMELWKTVGIRESLANLGLPSQNE